MSKVTRILIVNFVYPDGTFYEMYNSEIRVNLNEEYGFDILLKESIPNPSFTAHFFRSEHRTIKIDKKYGIIIKIPVSISPVNLCEVRWQTKAKAILQSDVVASARGFRETPSND